MDKNNSLKNKNNSVGDYRNNYTHKQNNSFGFYASMLQPTFISRKYTKTPKDNFRGYVKYNHD